LSRYAKKWGGLVWGWKNKSPPRGALLQEGGITLPQYRELRIINSSWWFRCGKDGSAAVRLKAAWALALLCERPGLVPARPASDYERHHAGLRLGRLVDWGLRCMGDSDKVSSTPPSPERN
jgi:hypothetical protein